RVTGKNSTLKSPSARVIWSGAYGVNKRQKYSQGSSRNSATAPASRATPLQRRAMRAAGSGRVSPDTADSNLELVERRRGEQLVDGDPPRRQPLLVRVLGERLEGGAVRLQPVGPIVRP